MGGVDHAEDALGARRVLTQIEQDVAGDALVGGVTTDAVTAGQVEQLHLLAVLADELARLLLHGDAGIVGDLLAEAGQRVEERGLAAVGVADDGVRFRAHLGGDDRVSLRSVMGNRHRRPGHRGDDVRGWGGHLRGADRCGLARLDLHLGGVGRADAQLEPAQAELHRVAERRAAEEGDGGSPEQSHLAETHREHSLAGKLGDHGALAGLERGEGNGHGV